MNTFNQSGKRAVLYSVAVCVAVMLYIPAGYGVVLWDVNFNSDTPGSPPATSGYVPTEPNPQEAVADGVGETILVQSSAGGLTAQPVVLTNTDDPAAADADPTLGMLDNVSFAAVSSGKVRISWDQSVISTDASDGNKVFAAQFGINPGGSVFYLIWTKNTVTGGDGNVNVNGGGQDTTPTWAFGVPQHYRVDLDLDADAYSLSIDGVPFATNISDPMPPGAAWYGVRFFNGAGVTGPPTANFVVAIDNYLVRTLVPEPSTVALLLMGGALAWRRGRRLQK